VFEWAMTKTTDWKPVYYMALLQGATNNFDKTLALLATLDEKPDFAPFYVLRAQLSHNEAEKERDLKKAVSLDPKEWRYIHRLTNCYLDKKDYALALQTVRSFYATSRNHFPTASLYMRALTYTKKYEEAEKILNTIHILPFEGERGGRMLYREIKTMLATQALAKGRLRDAEKKVAEAFVWPRNMGVGKPYDDQIDTRLEDWLNAMIAIKTGNTTNKDLNLRKVAQSTHRVNDPSTLLQCIALSKLGDKQKANVLFDNWSSLQRNNKIKEWGEQFYNNNKEKEYPFNLDEMTQLIDLISGGRDMRLF
jgi:hypothetical protein